VTTPILQRSSSGSDTSGWEGYCDAPSFSLGTEFDMPSSQPVATSTSGCDIDVLEDIDPDEIEKLCVEAELARKNSKKQYSCTTEVNELYALVIQHGRRKTRQQSQEEEERSVLKFTVLFICCL
jgi:hypothetical protein